MAEDDPGDWVSAASVQQPAQSASDPGDWISQDQAYKQQRQLQTIDTRDPEQKAAAQRGYLGRVWDAFKTESESVYGDRPLMDQKDIQWFQDNLGLFKKGTQETEDSWWRAAADGLIYNAIRLGEIGRRSMEAAAALTHGVGAAALEAGVPRDIAGVLGGEYIAPGAGSGAKTILEQRRVAIEAMTKVNDAMAELKQARDLGVIGPKPPDVTTMKPAEAAVAAVKQAPTEPTMPARTMAAEGPKGETLKGPEPKGQPNDWRGRFDQFVSKITTDDEAKDLIRNAADVNEDFPQARQGDIPLKQVEDLARAAGVHPSTVDADGVGRFLHNDNMVRNAMQAMLQSTEDVKSAAREVMTAAAGGADDTALANLQEAMLRRDTWVEQVVGHRAEWGRTGNVFQEFLQAMKQEQGFSEWLKSEGGGFDRDRLKKVAKVIANLPDGGVPKALSDANQPRFRDKLWWVWMNDLISGPVTHAKYLAANSLFAAYEHGPVSAVAGVVGAGRRAITGGEEGARVGEALPRLWGLIAGTPDAIRAGGAAFKSGLQTPLPGELAQKIVPKQNVAFSTSVQPIPGTFGRIIGTPSRAAAAIHSTYNSLGYNAAAEGIAYRQAASEGLSPATQAFWERQANIRANLTPEQMNEAIGEAYHGTFINDLGKGTKLLAAGIRAIPGGRYIMPFMHIPLNIIGAAAENVPVLNFAPEKARADILGRNGAVAQDRAIARVVIGTSVGVWAMNKVINDTMTGYGPTDKKERDQWFATGHQPYSIKIGNEWVSFNKFGPIGTMLGLYANFGEALPYINEGDEAKGAAMITHSVGRLLTDEVGMQGLSGVMNLIDRPETQGVRFTSQFAGSWLPFSSLLRQTASAMDPYTRETKTFVDGLRYYIPANPITPSRAELEPRRDWLGHPIPNAGYGGDIPMVPGVSAIIQHRSAVPDRLGLEMQALDLHPTVPENNVGGVKLTPDLYDRYQAIAGTLTESSLNQMMNLPFWDAMPAVIRAQAFQKNIKASREMAGAILQMQFNDILKAGIGQHVDQIMGVPQQRPKKPPASLEDISLPHP